jgi:hypothetical protein
MDQHSLRQSLMHLDSESCTGFLGRLVGITLLFPFALTAYIIAWITISLIGIIIFVGFPFAAIFLDTIRWVATNYNDARPNPEYLANRLKKAAMVIINIFEIMAELKRTELRNPDPHTNSV